MSHPLSHVVAASPFRMLPAPHSPTISQVRCSFLALRQGEATSKMEPVRRNPRKVCRRLDSHFVGSSESWRFNIQRHHQESPMPRER